MDVLNDLNDCRKRVTQAASSNINHRIECLRSFPLGNAAGHSRPLARKLKYKETIGSTVPNELKTRCNDIWIRTH